MFEEGMEYLRKNERYQLQPVPIKKKKFKEYKNSQIIMISQHYLARDLRTMSDTASYFDTIWKCGLTQKMVSKLMFAGIAKDVLNDNHSKDIYWKVVNAYSKNQTHRADRWDYAFKLRKITRKIKLLESKQEEVRFQILSHDQYACEDAPTTDDLRQQLRNIKDEIETLNQEFSNIWDEVFSTY